MFFEKLIEQHRVYRFVANGVSFSVSVAGHQVGIYFFHVLSQKAELSDAIGVKLVLVAERDRFEREDNFTGLIHRLDLVFESLRGNDCAEFTVGIDNYPTPPATV